MKTVNKLSRDLSYVIGTVYHIEGTHDWDGVRRFLNQPDFPERDKDFRRELSNAILNHTIPSEEYVKLTDDDGVESPQDVEKELRLLWQYIYGEEPIKP